MDARRHTIDFNLDLGEGYGIWELANDEWDQLLLASSVNLACGFHAGDPSRMRAAVERATREGVAVGAHPGLPDPMGFGRRPMILTPSEVKDSVTYQVGALQAFTTAAGIPLHHVKLHGQLSRLCTDDRTRARAFVEAVAELDETVPIYHEAISEVTAAAEELGVRVVAEMYAETPLRADGSRLVADPRNPGHLTPDEVRARVGDFLRTGSVDACDGGRVAVHADTISVHNDGPGGLALARAVRDALDEEGVTVSADLPPAGRVT